VSKSILKNTNSIPNKNTTNAQTELNDDKASPDIQKFKKPTKPKNFCKFLTFVWF